MADTNIHINIEGSIFVQINKLRQEFSVLNEKVAKIETQSKSSFSSLQNDIKNISFVSLTQGFANISQAFENIATPGLKFNASMTELKAMSGLTGKELDNLGKMARENAKIFGGDAAKSVETYKLLIAQLGPEIAKQPKVLNAMAQNAEILAKSMGGDVVGAADVLATAMHQYGVDLTDATGAQEEMTKMMNAMSASANAGASELPQLQQAVGVAGGSAKRAGVEFEQMLTALQFLDNASYKASEGGTALRAVLDKLQAGRFLPKEVRDELDNAGIDVNKLADKTVSFTDKLRMLQPIAKDTALIGKLFGGPYAGAAQALIATADAQDEMTESIKGTNSAQEYAATMMESTEEKLSRMKARMDDWKVSVFEATGGLTAYLTPLSEIATQVSAFAPIYNIAGKGVRKLSELNKTHGITTKIVTAAQWLWNAAMNANPIGLIITGVAALGAGVYALTKYIQGNTVANRANADVTKRVKAAMVDERVELNLLFTQLKKTNPQTKERAELVKELNDKYPDLLTKYDMETMKAKELDGVQKELIKNIKNRITAEIKTEKAKELLKEAEEAKGKNNFQLNVWTNKQKYEYINELEAKAESLINEATDLQNTGKSKSIQKNTEDVQSEETTPPIKDLANPPTNKTTSSSSGSSSSGGGEKRNISVKIDRLVEKIIIQTTNLKESTGDIKKAVSEALIGAVRDFEVAI